MGISRHRLDSFREAGDLRCVLQRGQEDHEEQGDLVRPGGDIEISERGKEKLMQYLNSSGSTLDGSEEVKEVHRDEHGGRDSKAIINKENKSDHNMEASSEKSKKKKEKESAREREQGMLSSEWGQRKKKSKRSRSKD